MREMNKYINIKYFLFILIIVIFIVSIIFILNIIKSYVASEEEYYIQRYLLLPYTEYIANNLIKYDNNFKDIDKWKCKYNFEEYDFNKFYKSIYNHPEVYIHSSQKQIKVVIIAKNEEYKNKSLSGIYSIEYDIVNNKIIYYNKGF